MKAVRKTRVQIEVVRRVEEVKAVLFILRFWWLSEVVSEKRKGKRWKLSERAGGEGENLLRGVQLSHAHTHITHSPSFILRKERTRKTILARVSSNEIRRGKKQYF